MGFAYKVVFSPKSNSKVFKSTNYESWYPSNRTLFSINYEIGKTSFPIEGSMGIFIFKDIKQAKTWLSLARFNKHQYKILKVQTYGRIKNRKRILDWWRPEHFKLYKNNKDILREWESFTKFCCPEGVYTCDAVKPLKLLKY